MHHTLELASATSSSGTTVFEYLPPMLMVVGILMIGVLLVVSIRGKVARRNADTPTAREQIDAIKARAAGEAQRGDHRADEARVDMVELSRRLASQLDAKAERLEQLIAEADERLAMIEHALQLDVGAVTPVSLSTSIRAQDEGQDEMSDDAQTDPLTEAVYELADAGCAPVEIAQRLEEQTGKVELILALRREN